jgi:hypothetical protein
MICTEEENSIRRSNELTPKEKVERKFDRKSTSESGWQEEGVATKSEELTKEENGTSLISGYEWKATVVPSSNNKEKHKITCQRGWVNAPDYY